MLATGDDDLSQVHLRRMGDAFLYRANNYHFFQLEGDTLTGYNPAHTDPLPFELEFLESGISLYFEREGIPVLHGAAVTVDGQAVLLIAGSQSGKSSLTISLIKAGYHLISDDIIPILPDHRIEPGHGHLRMWHDTAEQLLDPGWTRPLFPKTANSKRVTDVSKWGQLADHALPIGAVFLVNAAADQQAIQIEPLHGFRAVNTLLAHSPLLAMHGYEPREKRVEFFVEFLSQIPLSRLTYPRSFDHLPHAVDALVSTVRNK